MKNFLLALATFLISTFSIHSHAQELSYYELRTYHCSSLTQIERLDQYLENTFFPLLHDNGLKNVGVFHLIANDTLDAKKLFVLIPTSTLSALEDLSDQMVSPDQMKGNGQDYLYTPHDNPVYDRIETSWLRAFESKPQVSLPNFPTPVSDHIFELRSYEGASEHLYRKKVDMFNAGGEIALFKSLNFNAVFYAETLVGPRTPNLVYMTSFENLSAREEHWDLFRNDPRWEKLKSLKKYQHTVSKADIYLLRPASYSDIK